MSWTCLNIPPKVIIVKARWAGFIAHFECCHEMIYSLQKPCGLAEPSILCFPLLFFRVYQEGFETAISSSSAGLYRDATTIDESVSVVARPHRPCNPTCVQDRRDVIHSLHNAGVETHEAFPSRCELRGHPTRTMACEPSFHESPGQHFSLGIRQDCDTCVTEQNALGKATNAFDQGP